MAKKLPKIKIIKFRTDKTLVLENAEIDKQIMILNKEEGYEAREEAYLEIKQDVLFGFKEGKPFGAFAVREVDPSPLVLSNDGYLGSELVFDDYVRHENEAFRREMSRTEEGKKSNNDEIIKYIGWLLMAEIVVGAILTLLKGVPSF